MLPSLVVLVPAGQKTPREPLIPPSCSCWWDPETSSGAPLRHPSGDGAGLTAASKVTGGIQHSWRWVCTQLVCYGLLEHSATGGGRWVGSHGTQQTPGARGSAGTWGYTAERKASQVATSPAHCCPLLPASLACPGDLSKVGVSVGGSVFPSSPLGSSCPLPLRDSQEGLGGGQSLLPEAPGPGTLGSQRPAESSAQRTAAQAAPSQHLPSQAPLCLPWAVQGPG